MFPFGSDKFVIIPQCLLGCSKPAKATLGGFLFSVGLLQVLSVSQSSDAYLGAFLAPPVFCHLLGFLSRTAKWGNFEILATTATLA